MMCVVPFRGLYGSKVFAYRGKTGLSLVAFGCPFPGGKPPFLGCKARTVPTHSGIRHHQMTSTIILIIIISS